MQTLEQLRQQYIDDVEDLEIKIEKYKQRLRQAQKIKDFDDVFICQRLLKVFHHEKEDMKFTIKALTKYIEGD